MRVVIINDVSIARGGATALALLEARLLRERGVSVVFATGDTGDNPMFDELEIPVVSLGESRLLDAGPISAVRGLYNRRTTDVLGRAFAAADTQDTVYHVHGWSQILSPALFVALKPYLRRTVISAHDFFLACPNGAYANFPAGRSCALRPLSARCIATNCDKRSYGHKLWRACRQFLQGMALRYEEGCPRVLMIHEAMREPLRRAGLPDECLQALPNPVTAWRDTRIAAEANREFLFVGRFTKEKGPDLAARAARRAGVPMTFIGDGPMLEAMRAEYTEFTFLGRLPAERIACYAAQARALVMPSRYPEPYGLVLVEALWSGLPTLVARDALLASDIVERGAGVAYDVHDDAALAAALCATEDDERVRMMSISAFNETRDFGLSRDAWATRLLDGFAACLRVSSDARSVAAASGTAFSIVGEDPHVFHRQH